MKYIKYLLLVQFTLFRKTFGLVWFWAVFPFRKYARSVVQNYALQKRRPLKRLEQRQPFHMINQRGWGLRDGVMHHVGRDGYVAYRSVSTLEYWLVVFLLWGWVDDDSNNDTYDANHLNRYLSGDLQDHIMTKLFRKQMQKAVDKATYGNTFDLGDYRADDPNFSFIGALVWNFRNTGYNFQYLLETVSTPKDVFLIEIKGWKFGWIPNGEVNGTKWYKMIIGKNW